MSSLIMCRESSSKKPSMSMFAWNIGILALRPQTASAKCADRRKIPSIMGISTSGRNATMNGARLVQAETNRNQPIKGDNQIALA